MKAGLLDKEVLAMYDVRGIQSYIFKSNVAKEIIGASKIVEKIVTDGLRAYIETLEETEKNKYMQEWETDDPEAFLKDASIMMQVMFVGGGNAYVLFRKGEVCQNVNRFLARYVLQKTYSLNLAIAVIEKTGSYAKDYKSINDEMRNIKAYMPLTQPVGALPFMAADSITGYPLSYRENGTYFCTEAKLKRAAFPKNEDEKVFDRMVTEKGDNSTLAVCHIDGNSIGKRIQNIMREIDSYNDAIRVMRSLSMEIAEVFGTTFEQMTAYMRELSVKVKKNAENQLYRKIIVAGDDITFVCNAKLALPAVRYFLSHVGEEKDYSACGGIAYFNSHFPFSDAYQVAESCCDNAKKRAKRPENRGKNEKIGNFLDFQICMNVRAANLDAYRDKHYLADRGYFIARPYYVPEKEDKAGLNEKNQEFDVGKLEYWEGIFLQMPRSKAKQLRNAIPMGENEIQKNLSFLSSRDYQAFEKSQEEYRIWYDALEIMDLSIGGDEDEDNN
ncbi:hypothetical protein I260019D6_19770 [Dorea longicatena]|uniref:hypothetical protein n=1 Tax=Dorea longicatena TaxID=88431 RepID=UPI0036F22B4C